MNNYQIVYEITPKNLHAHIFAVKLTLNNPNPLGQVFALPNWIPGSYLIRDFAKNIITISSKSQGQHIPLKKLDKNHWIAQPCSAEITVEYEIYAFDFSPRCAYLSDERGFFNGSSVFLMALGFAHLPAQIIINYPPQLAAKNWSCATTLKQNDDKNSHIYTSDNYADLIDNPVEMAEFTRFQFEANKIKQQMVISGRHNTDIGRLRQDLIRICCHHLNFFPDKPPFTEYLFLLALKSGSYGGLEHQNCSSLICDSNALPRPETPQMTLAYIKFLSLCAHEYFHAWWGKGIKPASFYTLDLNRENYTEQLWIFEGLTSYYDELSLLRSKIITPSEYLLLFAETITKVQKTAGRFKQSLAEASYDAWSKFYQQDENSPNALVSYYSKGALLAFVLDMQIRRKSDDKSSLDDVLRYCWKHYKQSGLEDNTIIKVVEKLSKSDFSKFFADYLYGMRELPLLSAFDAVGIDCIFVHKKNDLTNFGMRLKAKSTVISHIFDNSCAQYAGLYVGDKIITVDDRVIDYQTVASVIDDISENQQMKISVLRDELLLQKTLIKISGEPYFCILKMKQNLDEKTKIRQQKWFYSTD